MPEYITKEQAIDVVEEAIRNIINSDSESVNLTDLEIEIEMTITDYTDAADVVEVVRCKDCCYAELYEMLDYFNTYECTYLNICGERYTPIVEEGDYCSYGKRKDGGESDA